jgi:thiosulfate/3-mercaptopyruvate sulfurtransferase
MFLVFSCVPFTTLIDASMLARHLTDPSFAIVDCRFMLADPAWGERAYAAGHIPGAAYAHLDRDLSGEKTGTNGRHPLPTPEALRQTFGRLGIDKDVQVVAYDQDVGSYASRLWWLLRWMGHENVAVLDGGFARWLAEDRPVASGVEARHGRNFVGMPREDFVADAALVGALSDRADWRLVDARAPERFRGETETIDKVAGHIPGAMNYCYHWNLGEDGAFRTPEELRTRFQNALGDVSASHVVCYCGSGVTACHNLLALEHAGLNGARLYPGSWSEWSSDRSRPIDKGA